MRSSQKFETPLKGEYSSADDLLSPEQVVDLLLKQKLMVEDGIEDTEDELLR
jgi:hypothetical protein